MLRRIVRAGLSDLSNRPMHTTNHVGRGAAHAPLWNSTAVLFVTIFGNSTSLTLVTSGDHKPTRWAIRDDIDISGRLQ